jgi:hypothetical protein
MSIRAHSGRLPIVAALGAVVGAGLLLSAAGCAPCAGVAECASGPGYLAATGQIVEKASGAPVEGVRVDVVRRSGIRVAVDSLSAVTSAGGFWRVEFDPESGGTLLADIRVTPPNAAGYVVRNLPLSTRAHGGDANINDSWVTVPYFNYAGELFLAGTVDDRIQNQPVEFRIRSGVATRGTGVQDSVFRATTDVGGRVELFPKSAEGGLLPLGSEDLVGDLTVFLPAPAGPSVVRGIHLTPTYVYFTTVGILRYAVGP